MIRHFGQCVVSVAVLALLTVGSSAQQRSGILITTASSSSDSQQIFHSYWITMEGAQVRVSEGMRLLIPRADGWWEVGTTILKQMNSQAHNQEVWAVPLGSPHQLTHLLPISEDDSCSNDLSTYSVGWVGADFAVVHHDYESTCGGHPASGEESFTVHLDDLRSSHLRPHPQLKRANLSETAGGDAAKAMALGVELANTRAAQSSGDETRPQILANDSGWVVIRSKGHYHLLGTTAMERGRGGETYDIPFDPPKSLAGFDELAVGWDAVLDRMPDAQDAYTSPAGDILVVISPHYISVFDLQQQTIGTRRKRIAVVSPNVIAARWVTDSMVDRWSETIIPAFKKEPSVAQK